MEVTQGFREVKALLQSGGGGPILLHSDLFVAGGFLNGRFTGREQMLEGHLEVLQMACGGRNLWMPSFNYDFPRTRTFAPLQEPSQVGPLPEYFRTKRARWRTHVPIFSFTGLTDDAALGLEHLFAPAMALRVDPFGAGSLFDLLATRSGAILLYGAGLASSTFIHHVERASGGPLYRYDKPFFGSIVTVDGSHPVILHYHVRPMGKPLDYDMQRIERELLAAGILKQVRDANRIIARVIDAAMFKQFLLDRLATDPLHLLDQESRSWVEPELSRLGRRFELQDFEGEK